MYKWPCVCVCVCVCVFLCVYTRTYTHDGNFERFSVSPRKRHRRNIVLALFVKIVSFNFNALGPPMFKLRYPLAEGHLFSSTAWIILSSLWK